MYENLIASCTCLMWTAAEFLRAGGHFSIGRAVRKKRGDNRDYRSTRTEYDYSNTSAEVSE